MHTDAALLQHVQLTKRVQTRCWKQYCPRTAPIAPNIIAWRRTTPPRFLKRRERSTPSPLRPPRAMPPLPVLPILLALRPWRRPHNGTRNITRPLPSRRNYSEGGCFLLFVGHHTSTRPRNMPPSRPVAHSWRGKHLISPAHSNTHPPLDMGTLTHDLPIRAAARMQALLDVTERRRPQLHSFNSIFVTPRTPRLRN